MRNEGSPAMVAAARGHGARDTRIDTGHGAPRLPTLMAVNAPMPRNAACASDSSPVRGDEHVETERRDRGHDDADENRQLHVAE